MFHRILVPLDGSERAEQAIPVAVSLARANTFEQMRERLGGETPEERRPL